MDVSWLIGHEMNYMDLFVQLINKSLTWLFFLRMLLTYKGSYAAIDLQVSLFIFSGSVLIFYVRCTSCSLILNALVITEYVKPSHFTNFHDIDLQHSI